MSPNITIYLQEQDAKILSELAKSENRSVSNTVSTLIRNSASVVITALPRPDGAQVVPVIEYKGE